MYDALALAVKENGGKKEDVKKYMGYAADMAVKSRNPNHLISVADMLYVNGYFDRVGALVDQAAALVPHRAIPLVMSINLADKTKDPKRMADAIDKLLALGWPGQDEHVRRDAREAGREAREGPSARRGGRARPTRSSPGCPRPRPATSSSA